MPDRILLDFEHEFPIPSRQLGGGRFVAVVGNMKRVMLKATAQLLSKGPFSLG
jgi:hypothetical protein